MAREKSPGLKILWLWTIGTAAILVTSVMRTRLRDLENVLNAEQQQKPEPHNTPSISDSDNFNTQDK